MISFPSNLPAPTAASPVKREDRDSAGAEGDASATRRARARRSAAHAIRWCRSWFSPLRGRGLRQRVASIADFEDVLREHTRAIEQAFIATGAALGEQNQLAAALVAQGTRFAEFTSDEEAQNPIRHGIALVDRAIQRLTACHADSDALMDRLQMLDGEICRLQQHAAMLDRAIAPLKIVDTLFRIEASSLPPETQAAFGALTHDIAQLDGRVRQTFSRHFEALSLTRSAIDELMQHLESERVQHDRVAAEQRTAMLQTLAALEENIGRLRRRDERTAAVVRDIERETNGIVVALQYQDITRQKLEHVSSALAAMHERVEARAVDVPYVNHVARLQAAQLAAVDADIEAAIGAVACGLERVVARLREVESGGLDSHGNGHTGAEAGLIIDTLETTLPAVGAAVAEAAGSGRAAARAVRSFGQIAADLGASIRELTEGIRLIALNAQVQAAQVKRCDGLEVLARHTYVVSDETARLAEQIGVELGALNTQLQEAAADAQAFAQHTEDLEHEFTTSSASLRQDLEAERAAVAAALETFAPLVRQTREHAARLLEGAELVRLDRSAVTNLQAQLEQLGTWCGRQRAATLRAGALRQAFADLEQQYTMDSERAVHQAIVDGRDHAEGAAVTTVRPEPLAVSHSAGGDRPTPESPAALGDNVELF